jgi:hypothetical protein
LYCATSLKNNLFAILKHNIPNIKYIFITFNKYKQQQQPYDAKYNSTMMKENYEKKRQKISLVENLLTGLEGDI